MIEFTDDELWNLHEFIQDNTYGWIERTEENWCHGCGWGSRHDPRTPDGCLSHKEGCWIPVMREKLKKEYDARQSPQG